MIYGVQHFRKPLKKRGRGVGSILLALSFVGACYFFVWAYAAGTDKERGDFYEKDHIDCGINAVDGGTFRADVCSVSPVPEKGAEDRGY